MAKRDITQNSKTAAATIVARKAHLRTMIGMLTAMVEGVPDNGTWGTAGDLAHYEDILGDLVNPEE